MGIEQQRVGTCLTNKADSVRRYSFLNNILRKTKLIRLWQEENKRISGVQTSQALHEAFGKLIIIENEKQAESQPW